MKQELPTTTIFAAAAVVIVLISIVVWRMAAAPNMATVVHQRVGPQGSQLAPPPPGLTPAGRGPGYAMPHGAGPMAPPGAR